MADDQVPDDDTSSDHAPPRHDAFDDDIAERFRVLDMVTPPDVWARTSGGREATRPNRALTSWRGGAPLVAAAAVVVAGVAALQIGSQGTTEVDIAATSNDSVPSAACPVTRPTGPAFVPPSPWPATPSAEGFAWYGTRDLWTVLDRTDHTPRKAVFWSANFPGGAVEERPELEVRYRQLGGDELEIVFDAPGTNAFTAEDGDFMINGIEPDDPGCWLVTASYKGASLSYVYAVE